MIIFGTLFFPNFQIPGMYEAVPVASPRQTLSWTQLGVAQFDSFDFALIVGFVVLLRGVVQVPYR